MSYAKLEEENGTLGDKNTIEKRAGRFPRDEDAWRGEILRINIEGGGVMGIWFIGDEGGDEGMRERYERVLGDVKDLTRDLRDST